MPGSPEPSRVRTLKGALPLLRRPPAPQAVRFKPVIDAGSRCRLAAYTDVRFVIDQLNAVCGSRWWPRYEELPVAHRPTVVDDEERMLYVRCALTVFDVTRSDVGEGRDGTRFGAGPKAAYSDALKRAAVHFGVNQAIYALRAPWVDVHEGPGRCPTGHVARGSSGRLYVPDATVERLRRSYEHWLDGRGSAFGAPIDFGEQDDALGVEGDASQSSAPRPTPGSQTPAAGGSHAGADVVPLGAARAERPPARPAHPPADPADRAAAREVGTRAGLDDRGLGQLADLLYGEDLLDRLPAAQLAELRLVLEGALAARCTGADLRVAVETALAHPDRAAARSALLSQLARPA